MLLPNPQVYIAKRKKIIKESYYLNYLFYSIQLKFNMNIVGHSLTYCIDFAEIGIYTHFIGEQIRITYIEVYGVKVLKVR